MVGTLSVISSNSVVMMLQTVFLLWINLELVTSIDVFKVG